MPLLRLEAVGIPRDHVVEQPIEVSGLGGNAFFTLGYVNADFVMGLLKTATRFHVIDARTTYYFLLNRLWSIDRIVPSSYYQCLKANWRGKKLIVNESEAPFLER